MANGQEARRAPYVPWKTFTNFITGLKGQVIPVQVTRSVISNLNGQVQSQLLGALRFFELVEGDDDSTTPLLREFVEACGTPEWTPLLQRVVPAKYQEIVQGIDLEAGTKEQLREAIRTRGHSTGSPDKTMRFYLSAMTEAGLPLSPHFGGPARTTRANGSTRASRPRRATRSAKASGGGTPPAQPEVPPPGMREITCSLPRGRVGRVWVPADLTLREQEGFFNYLSLMLGLEREEEPAS